MIPYNQYLHNAGLTLPSRWGRWPAEESACQQQTAFRLIFWSERAVLEKFPTPEEPSRPLAVHLLPGRWIPGPPMGPACFPTTGNICWGRDPGSRETGDSFAIMGFPMEWEFMDRIWLEHWKWWAPNITCLLKSVSKAVIYHNASRGFLREKGYYNGVATSQDSSQRQMKEAKIHTKLVKGHG